MTFKVKKINYKYENKELLFLRKQNILERADKYFCKIW